MILPGVIILRDAGKTIIKPKIKASKNVFLYISKTFNLAITYNEKINTAITTCASIRLAILMI